jgi:hypothetical protein
MRTPRRPELPASCLRPQLPPVSYPAAFVDEYKYVQMRRNPPGGLDFSLARSLQRSRRFGYIYNGLKFKKVVFVAGGGDAEPMVSGC